MISDQIDKTPANFEIFSFAVIKVHLEKFACKIYRDTRTASHDKGVDISTNFGVVDQVKKLQIYTESEAARVYAELKLNFDSERLQDGNVILVIDDISKEVKKYLIDMKIQSISEDDVLKLAANFDDPEDSRRSCESFTMNSDANTQAESDSQVMEEMANSPCAAYFAEPPYTAGEKKAGKRLYKYCEIDHEKLSRICESLKGDFLIAYDNAEEVKRMVRRHGFEMRLIAMTNIHHAAMKELVIGKNLSWMDDAPVVREKLSRYAITKKVRKGVRS